MVSNGKTSYNNKITNNIRSYLEMALEHKVNVFLPSCLISFIQLVSIFKNVYFIVIVISRDILDICKKHNFRVRV